MIEIYDNGGKTYDRYTIFIDSDTECIGASEHGSGFYQHGAGTKGKHLGERIRFADLSSELQDRLKNEMYNEADKWHCEYELDGHDTDGTTWYLCVTHNEQAPSPDAPCAGYEEIPYEERLKNTKG